MKILIRCDADELIGIGHLKRCTVIGNALERRGHDVNYLLKKYIKVRQWENNGRRGLQFYSITKRREL